MYPTVHSLFLFLLLRWPDSFTWAILSDLLFRPRRAIKKDRLLKMQRQMRRALRESEYDETCRIAQECLRLAEEIGPSPMQQSAQYFCCRYWSWACCEKGEWEKAGALFLKSGQIKGTMSLRWIPLSLHLPRMLIENGQAKAVLAYFDELERWWVCGFPLTKGECEDRRQTIAVWKTRIQKGKVPRDHFWEKEKSTKRKKTVR